MQEYYAEVFDRDRYCLGESPYYDPRYKRYSWVDIIQSRLWTMQDGKKECFQFDQPIGAAVPLRESDGFMLAAQDGLYLLKDGKTRLVKDLGSIYKSYWRSNDAKADADGRLWFGASVGDDLHGAEGNLYCFDGKSVRCMQSDTKISNGMAWSKDEKHYYFSDSLEYAVFRYDYCKEKGTISGRNVLFRVEKGVPDGMCIDGNDDLWVAIWGGNRIEKRDALTGELLALVYVPAEHVTSCCLMRENRRTELFITSSAEGLSGEFDGCLFKCCVDVPAVTPDYVLL